MTSSKTLHKFRGVSHLPKADNYDIIIEGLTDDQKTTILSVLEGCEWDSFENDFDSDWSIVRTASYCTEVGHWFLTDLPTYADDLVVEFEEVFEVCPT